MMIAQPRSLILDSTGETRNFEALVQATHDLDGVGGYRIGSPLALDLGLRGVVALARRYTRKPLVYDHQKAGTDTPEAGRVFAERVREAGVSAVILFPQAGPETERAWVDYCRNEELEVIIGGFMGHRHYMQSDGGYIADGAIVEMYERAAGLGVNDYIIPTQHPELIRKMRSMLEREHSHPVFYFIDPPLALVEPKAMASIAGERYHVILGKGICDAADMREAARRVVEKIV